jgi:hypothetical protein
MVRRFAVGSTIQRREVLHGHVWLTGPVTVVADDDVLAVWLSEGAPLEFPPHPFGPHPWSGQPRWTGTSVLQVHRRDDAYAVWGFYVDGQFSHWYVNFQAPYRRNGNGFDTLDHGLDIVVHSDRWEWKDRDDVTALVNQGRISTQDADAIWVEAERVATTLDRGERWWLPRWQDWQPGQGQPAPGTATSRHQT